MGRLALAGNDLAAAEGYFARGVAVDGRCAPAHFNLSRVYAMQGRAAEANEEMGRYRAAAGAYGRPVAPER